MTRYRLAASAKRLALTRAALALALAGCDQKVAEPPDRPTPAAAMTPPAPATTQVKPLALALAPGLSQVGVLYSAQETPYGATLAFDADDVLLLTPTGMVRIPPEGKPVRRAIELGHQRAVLDDSVVFYLDGAFWSVSKRGNAAARRLLVRPQEPSALAAWGKNIAWTEKGGDLGDRLWTFDHGAARLLYAATGSFVALTLLGDAVVFVERKQDGGWQLGRVGLEGGEPRFLPGRGARAPSMLAVGAGAVFYCDGPGRSVRRVSHDFMGTEVLASGVVCSPLTVGDRVFCGRMEGIFQIPLDGSEPSALTQAPYGLVAALASSSRRVIWLNDSGKEQLTLRALELP